MKDVRINYSRFPLQNGGHGAIAVLMYSGKGDPKKALDEAVFSMVNSGIGYSELIDANLDNPWTRVLLTNINDMKQENFDTSHHSLQSIKDGTI